ncbi:hypothetical protein L1049_008430 [Liquidambar formosana]|uniref:Serine/arginine-rich splicing factor 4 n=1 Tax=Liquidambar formosana TaxID=63359 RepID=A0AAP0S6E5_LIQFO
MSLFLGNLSSHIRRDELDHVFKRFGRCNVQLKDGYGFVVYDFPPNAEKALRALRGKNICGEPITLTWSNKQPRPFQRFVRGRRSYEVRHGRTSARGKDYANRKFGSNGRRDFRMGIKQPDSDGRGLNSTDILDEEVSYHHDNIKDYAGERHHNKEDLPDEGGSIEPNLMDSDRWGQQVGDPSNNNGVENGMEFDRYEPYHGYDKRDEDENNQVTYSGGSPILGDSQEKTGKEQIGGATLKHTDSPKLQQKCYLCGELGHKMRNCPQENAYRRKKFTRFDPRQDDEINHRGRGEGELKRLGSKSKSRGRPLLGRENILMRRHRNDSRQSGLGKHRRLIRRGSSHVEKKTLRAQRRDYGGQRGNKREYETPKIHRAKKARGSISSPLHSNYTASRSRSHSRSLRSILDSSSRSRSRSVSSSRRSLSSSSRSGSALHYSRSGSYKSRSRSSSPTSLSLFGSYKSRSSSPNKLNMNMKGSFDNATCPESEAVLVEQRQEVAGDAGSENSKLEITTMAVNNENAVSSFKAEDMAKVHPQQRDVDENSTMLQIVDVEENPFTLPLEKGAFVTGSLSPESLREERETQNSGALVVEHRLAPTKEPDSEPISSRTCNSMSISPKEMYMVLKHYGLDHPEENEMQPAEAYFGSARFWPWEIIYYRRLKKGPISTENYAMRIAQNREFGIVDKYIRSSSGWGELNQENS